MKGKWNFIKKIYCKKKKSERQEKCVIFNSHEPYELTDVLMYVQNALNWVYEVGMEKLIGVKYIPGSINTWKCKGTKKNLNV